MTRNSNSTAPASYSLREFPPRSARHSSWPFWCRSPRRTISSRPLTGGTWGILPPSAMEGTEGAPAAAALPRGSGSSARSFAGWRALCACSTPSCSSFRRTTCRTFSWTSWRSNSSRGWTIPPSSWGGTVISEAASAEARGPRPASASPADTTISGGSARSCLRSSPPVCSRGGASSAGSRAGEGTSPAGTYFFNSATSFMPSSASSAASSCFRIWIAATVRSTYRRGIRSPFATLRIRGRCRERLRWRRANPIPIPATAG
mmetsp:Transcript_9184/g.27627  ORF Transcript_9184/g.27627 Transcript_9184/m.27627 type:complete len:261 (+) Transcript_9184:473-1255(+)